MVEMYLNPMLICDFYKVAHRQMFPKGTTLVYETWTPRASRVNGVEEIVVFGLQATLCKLEDFFSENFFGRDISIICQEYKEVLKETLGVDADTKHIEELHALGYFPLCVKGLPEGVVVPTRVPVMTVHNTDPRFFWLPGYLETFMSCEMWQASTSATLAREYRKILDRAALKTVGNTDFVPFQGHDFSMRGMSSLHSAISSGMGHLTSFVGTDTIPAIQMAKEIYKAEGLVGTSIPASEHSIQCAYGDDVTYFKTLINEVHPTGFVSIVSDGYDFWDVLGRVVVELKGDIMARDGRVVIRPDSGDPVKIVCGDPDAKPGSLEYKGAVEVLWDVFGGTNTSKGYKILDSHIGLIYGDAITLNRCQEICNRLEAKGFASINCVFGIGSYTYQYNTRDTFGYALKSTLCVINGEEKQIFKDPKTDNGIKRSQKGRVVVIRHKNDYRVMDGFSLNDEIAGDQLQVVYENGNLIHPTSFAAIRERAARK